LLADLLKHTPDAHPDHANLQKALASMRETGEFINERKRDAENMTKLQAIHSSMKGPCPALIEASRRFVAEDTVGVVKKPGAAPRHGVVYLFTDSVLITRNLGKGKFLFKSLIGLANIDVQKQPASKNLEHGLKVVDNAASPKSKHTEWLIEFPSDEEREQWQSKTTTAKTDLEKRRRSFREAKK
jgi:hypothetical protein